MQEVLDLESISLSLQQEKVRTKEGAKTFLKEVKTTEYVDYLDSNKLWKAAKLMSRDDSNMATLRPLGWPASNNERVPLINSRVRPFRSESSTDTSCNLGAYPNNEVDLLNELVQVFRC